VRGVCSGKLVWEEQRLGKAKSVGTNLGAVQGGQGPHPGQKKKDSSKNMGGVANSCRQGGVSGSGGGVKKVPKWGKRVDANDALGERDGVKGERKTC